MRWVTILAAGYALSQMLAYADPARVPGLADPAPWRPPGTRTAGLIQAGIARILRVVGLPALVAAIPPEFRPASRRRTGRPPPEPRSPTDPTLPHRPCRPALKPGAMASAYKLQKEDEIMSILEYSTRDSTVQAQAGEAA